MDAKTAVLALPMLQQSPPAPRCPGHPVPLALLPLEAVPGGNHANIAEAVATGASEGPTAQGGEQCACSGSWFGKKLPREGVAAITELLPGDGGSTGAMVQHLEGRRGACCWTGSSQLLWQITCSIFFKLKHLCALCSSPHQPHVLASKNNPSALHSPFSAFWSLTD